jgi:hypothetical protein
MLSARTIFEEVFRRRLDALPAETRRRLLLRVAHRLEPIDAGLARASCLDALVAAVFADRLAGPDGSLLAVLRRALRVLGSDLSADPELRWLSLAFGSAVHIWDDEGFAMLSCIRCWNCDLTIAEPHGRPI